MKTKLRNGIYAAVVMTVAASLWAVNTRYVQRVRALHERHALVNWVKVEAFHPDGRKFFEQTNPNLRTNAGADAQASQMGNTGTQAAACNYIALTNTAITPNATDTTLAGEISANGLGRAQGTYSHTNGTAQFTVQKTFTATGAQAAQASGLFNASSSGTLCFENTFTQVSLQTNDTLQITWTINY